ncbi:MULTISPECIES: hypothetical protein [Klebsiella]|nr:hypothetical protein [Klebsiella aerogenes]SXN18751.1 Uncharacterised protein [Klebsiella pneumoniae]HBR4754309.1 hypothetical protein [Klebsiella pneumoniae]HBW0982200.1 hypothetical protein [Klebsiella aerogenes]HBW0985622.1 hypothetical protein [Klebsiella aerogenes]HBW1023872.1 hypothetical protein [Klebsiella pneumoniae]
MMAHDVNRDDYIYEHDKPVYVRSYCRVRFGELENVRQHFRSYPVR